MALFIWLLQKVLRTPVWQPRRHVRIWTGLAIVFVPVFAIFCRFGGAFHSDGGVPWESAARTRYVVLNEAILDDGQALYRAYSTHKRATEKALRPISGEELEEAIAQLGGHPEADSIEAAFSRRTTSTPLTKRPHTVALLVCLWPSLATSPPTHGRIAGILLSSIYIQKEQGLARPALLLFSRAAPALHSAVPALAGVAWAGTPLWIYCILYYTTFYVSALHFSSHRISLALVGA